MDVTSDVPPKQFVRGEWLVGIALLTGILWVGLYSLTVEQGGASIWWPPIISFVIGFVLRMLTLYRGGRAAREGTGRVSACRWSPLFGRKLAGSRTDNRVTWASPSRINRSGERQRQGGYSLAGRVGWWSVDRWLVKWGDLKTPLTCTNKLV
jgi:hypothetical protein